VRVRERVDRVLLGAIAPAQHGGGGDRCATPGATQDVSFLAEVPVMNGLYGVDAEKGVAIYHRWGNAAAGRLERFIVVLNFSPDAQTVDIPFSGSGVWEDLLSGQTVNVGGSWLGGAVIQSNWGRVYYQYRARMDGARDGGDGEAVGGGLRSRPLPPCPPHGGPDSAQNGPEVC
jgi:hypothetical protein